ncbi:putative ABC transport system ATP-binding protein [Actinomadura coerulea]|uniref:Putative ABC transport system ATP-binding protein n=1 Tax=Actinomadura coerulea TaxID=46159 RepID=A0A7X0G116_9ACTN|nr:ABC transporter ATP-binding protein [Actinomadura coerulea]MBB6397437.1 putative ABC transport system ATP-binding protein [Actinomadura coerulea]GGQ02605.1 ABC transporter [Actinomadura coerulea]
MNDAVRMDAVSKVYGRGRGAVAALREVSATLPRGRLTAVMGPSGSGKSTFLHCAAGLDTPTSGTVRLGDTELSSMNETKLTELRRRRVGFVFQAFNLVSSLTVEQNIILPLRLSRTRPDKAWLTEVVARVGLADRTGHRPGQLSGGQQQRVAIARALVTRPDVVFGDEPTGALDTMTARDVLTLLRETVDGMGQTVVMVTHDPVAASYADTVLFLADGRIVDSMDAPSSDKVAARMTRLGAWK